MGGSGRDQIRAARLDSAGRLYVARFHRNQRPPGHHQYLPGRHHRLDGYFIAVIDTTPGKGFPILYFSYAGGTGNDIPLAMALDSSGNIYLTGDTNSTDFPTAGSAIQTAGAGSNLVSGFVLELNPGFPPAPAVWSTPPTWAAPPEIRAPMASPWMRAGIST